MKYFDEDFIELIKNIYPPHSESDKFTEKT